MVTLKILSLILWLLVVPFCMGLLFVPFLGKSLRTPGVVLTSGYILMFTILELAGIPVVLLAVYNGMTIFTRIFMCLLILCALAGLCVAWWVRKEEKKFQRYIYEPFFTRENRGQITGFEIILSILFLILAGFQLYMAFTRASFDGDDAYYGVQALIAQQMDTLYRINPYTGRSAPLDVRHALALFPVWEAYIGKMSDIHATVICHSVMPLVLIPLTYILYCQLGKALLGKRREMLPMFMFLIALWQMFGNISIYTTETFFLTRTWQGKSFAGNFVIPAVLWIFLCIGKDEDSEKGGLWMLLACLNLAGGASSSLAILLSCLMSAGYAILLALRERRPGIFIRAGLTCIPGGIYVLLYLALTHGLLVP